MSKSWSGRTQLGRGGSRGKVKYKNINIAKYKYANTIIAKYKYTNTDFAKYKRIKNVSD